MYEKMEALEKAASPGPWVAPKQRLFADDGRHGIATFEDQGHSDPHACAKLASRAPTYSRLLREAGEAIAARGEFLDHQAMCDDGCMPAVRDPVTPYCEPGRLLVAKAFNAEREVLSKIAAQEAAL